MDVNTTRKKLDKAVSAAERKLNALKALREAMDDDDVAADLEEVFAIAANGKQDDRDDRPVPRSMQKVDRFFKKNGNAWSTIKEIETGAKINVSTLRQLLYRTRVDRFERDSQSGFGKESRFKLKNFRK